KVSGTYEATSREEVLAMITSNGYYPLLVEEVKQSADINIGFAQKVGLTDISVFCRQFYTMLDAGVTINSALNILSHQLPNKRLREVVKLVEESVSKGETLSEGMRRHLDVFPPLLVSMIEVGEASGNLDSIMERMSTQYEKENKINNKVKSAMIYPIILGIVAVGVVIFILTFVMPTFITMFTDEGIDLPITTRMLISASDFLQANIIYLALVGAVLGVSIRLYSKTESGQYTFSHLKLKVPVIKALNEKIIVSRFTRTMSALMASGIPMMKALELVAEVIGNKVAEDALIQVRDKVATGEGLAEPMNETKIFPEMLGSMIKIGEETGSLDEILVKTAYFYDDELEHQIQTTTAMIEPLMILTMGVVVGFIIVSIMTPMFTMYENM
ncbi:MAG: type II secretion system F family protein, partial [Turicibacter sp.]